VYQVSERVQKAEDIVTSLSPTVFLKLTEVGNSTQYREGWVFEKRGSTKICEDVTERARAAAAAR
jgi:hypothetical protein